MAKTRTNFTTVYSFYHYLRSAGAHFPAEEGEKRRPVNTNPDAVDSQREADEIAMAIQMSLNEEKQKEKQKQEQKQPVRFEKISPDGRVANPNLRRH